jgi:betaine lipid synthase
MYCFDPFLSLNVDDAFRSKFLWGRKPLLASCAARLSNLESSDDMIWVDLGGGTGENVSLMEKYMDISKFKKVYVVDLCSSLCKEARKKVRENGWKNVTVVEGDACQFAPEEGVATLVTFSYSLSMIPTFHAAVDKAVTYLDQEDGLLGICDFFTSSKYDLPLRQMTWARRFFWRSVFDTDNIDIGPERRQYLDHALSRVWEYNDEGSIPYVPYFRAPYYVAIYTVPKLESLLVENKVEAPPRFPPTFLYTQSWEDPHKDEPYLQAGPGDVCLTLTSGGCNSLKLCLDDVKAVYSVDCNPAQNALLELKQVAIRRLEYEDFWKLFGEGKHENFPELLEKELAPFMTQKSIKFWRSKAYYFKDGLYYHGGMGKVVWTMQVLFKCLFLQGGLRKMLAAETVEEQKEIFNSWWLIKLFKTAPPFLMSVISDMIALLLFNRVTLWFGAGVPLKQYQLIKNDGVHMSNYAARTFLGVIEGSLISKENYFYYNCLTGRFSKDNCPDYLTKEGFDKLKNGKAVDSLHIVSDFFLPTLLKRKYTKVILMDHVDWLDDTMAKEVAKALGQQVVQGGRVIWRSAAYSPRYAAFIKDAGFSVERIQVQQDGEMMDKVNMYSSFYLAIKK